MIMLTYIACILIGFAIYNFICAFSSVPTSRTSKMMLLVRKRYGNTNDELLDVYITKLANRVAPFVKLDKIKKSKLKSALEVANMSISPEVYTLKAYITSVLICILALPIIFVLPIFFPVVIAVAVTMWFATYYKVFDFVKKRKKLLEFEIPRFALTISQNLENDRDVLKILSSYRRVAGRDFGAELDKTIADMKTGNYERALLNFESRVSSTLLSDVVRGLIGSLRGDDQRMYFKIICFDMRQIEHSNLKKEASKRPKQIQKYSMMMLFCIVLIYLVVLSSEVLGSIGSFFG